MDFELTDDQKAFQATARAFARERLAPGAGEWDAHGVFPRAAIEEAGTLGFCGIYARETSGGLGLSRLDATVVFEALAASDPSTAAYLSIHNMVTWMVANWATPPIRDRWAPQLAAGTRLGSYCLTEPGAGSDAAALSTKATPCPGGYVLDGAKAFISGAGETDLLVVMARTGEPGARGISAFAVPADSPGIGYGRKEMKLGWNTQPTRAVTFDRVQVDADQLLGAEGDGFGIAMRGLDGGRINIAACSVGAAQGALDAAHRYVGVRKQFKQPLSSLQSVQFKLADMLTELVAARQMVRCAAVKLDIGAPNASLYCAMAKRIATDTGFSICNEAVQLHGGYGCTSEYPVERLLRDARMHQIVEGTNEIMRVIVARQILEAETLENL